MPSAHVGVSLLSPPWAFQADALDEADDFYRQHGFALLQAAIRTEDLAQLTQECTLAQLRLAEGQLAERFGTTRFDGPRDADGRTGTGTEPVPARPNYVSHVTELSPTAGALVHQGAVTELVHRWLGPTCWSTEGFSFGFVYQDARPGPDSNYKRIGWHSDWQSSPHLDIWPSTAVTLHIDGTSPANGFLRVVPGSHRWATPAPYVNANGALVPAGAAPAGGYSDQAPPLAMPLGFDKVPGEVAVYCQPGDVLFHDCYLWHSAALATDMQSRRRHVRGGWFSGLKPSRFDDGDFVKNAAR